MSDGVRIRLKRNTAANWTASNPVLMLAEPGLEVLVDGTPVAMKYGDGVTPWNSLAYFGTGAGGAVDSVNGRTGTVTGLAEASDLATEITNRTNAIAALSTVYEPIGGDASGVYQITQATHGLAVGNVVRLSGASYVKAQANTAANADVIGIISAVADVNNFTFTLTGRVTGLSGLTAGAYFLSAATAGLLTATPPSTTGQIVKPVFQADSATSGFVQILLGVQIA